MKKKLLILSITVLISHLIIAQGFGPIQIIDPNTGQEPYEIASGDLDGDGDIDVVMATYFFNNNVPVQDYIRWYKNDGLGNFEIQPDVSSTIRWVDGLTVADIDGVNGLDIIATSANQNKLVYFLSTPSGGFGEEVVVDAVLLGPGAVVAGDINKDGNTDIATVSYSDDKTVWYAGNGSGGFEIQPPIESGSENRAYFIDMADFDGDSDLDVVVGFFDSQTIEVYYNQYDGSDPASVAWTKDSATVDSGSAYILIVSFADVNNDGVLDVLKVDNSGGEVAWYNKVGGVWTEHIISDASIIARPGTAMVADLNNDTFNDVIVTDGGTMDDAIIWFEGANNANPSTTPFLIANNNHQMFDITVADFDGDSDLDVAAIGNSSDTVEWFANQFILGLANNTFNDVRMFPNPTIKELYFKGIEQTTSVSIYDIVGKNIMQASLEPNRALDVSALQSGVYMLKFDNYNQTIKFIKE